MVEVRAGPTGLTTAHNNIHSTHTHLKLVSFKRQQNSDNNIDNINGNRLMVIKYLEEFDMVWRRGDTLRAENGMGTGIGRMNISFAIVRNPVSNLSDRGSSSS
jgi:hypothetical protein